MRRATALLFPIFFIGTSGMLYWAAALNYTLCESLSSGRELSCVVVEMDECDAIKEPGVRRGRITVGVQYEGEVRGAILRATECKRTRIGDEICVRVGDHGDLIGCEYPACSYVVMWSVLATAGLLMGVWLIFKI
jgi:hypothetical protein